MLEGVSLWGGVLSGGLSQLQDTNALTKGRINKTEFAVQTAENVTGAVGVMAGIEYGAIWGSSVMPGYGTIIGGVLGALLGDRLGRTIGHTTGNAIFNNGNWMSGQTSQAGQSNLQTQTNGTTQFDPAAQSH